MTARSSMTAESAAIAAAQSSAGADAVGKTPTFLTREQRLGSLAGALALRASDWGWRSIYERWRRGEPVSTFHRKFLAISAHYRARGRGEGFDHRIIARIRPLPARSR
jgi:hypothetical protein